VCGVCVVCVCVWCVCVCACVCGVCEEVVEWVFSSSVVQ